MENLRQHALLTKVSVHRFSFKETDKTRQEELATKYNVDMNMIDVKKSTFLKEQRSELEKTMNAIVPLVHTYTAPWKDGGWRILPVKLYPKYEEKLREATRNIEDALDNFLLDYDSKIRIATARLGGMADMTDYPSPEYIRGRFGVDIQYDSITDSNHVILEASEEIINSVKNNMDSNYSKAVDIAMKDTWERVVTALERMYERLSTETTDGKKPRLFGSIVDNIKELVELLPGLNITNDPKLEQVRQELEKRFSDITIKDIKEDDDIRKASAKDAKEILDTIKGIF